ncbi:T9SS type A sorting domain-containing protein [bacterium]|nr:T9SS type A sorting domain-containing protein [bacterium]
MLKTITVITALCCFAYAGSCQTTDDVLALGSTVFAADFYDVLYHAGYLWIADGGQYYSGNLKALDVSDPENPQIAASDSYSGGSAFRLDAEGGLLLVSVKGHGLKIYDTSDPLSMTIAGEYVTTETINDMDILGDLLLLLSQSSGLLIFDISDPGNLVQLSQTSISGSRYSLAVTSDSLLTIASGTTGLHIYSIADPSAPRLMDTVTLDQKGFHDVVCNDTHAYAVYRQVMINSGGFAVVDLSDPPNFEILAQPTAFGVDPFPDNGLFLTGDTLFFAATQGGFGVWDISDPENPSRYGGWGGAWLPGNLARWSTRCTAGGGNAYNISPDRLLTATKNEACVFDISDLTDPTPIGFHDPPDWVHGAVGDGDFAYVASSNDGLLVVDISDPENPEIVGGENQLFVNLSATSVLYEDSYAYVSGGWTTLKIFDVSDPADPTVVSTFEEGCATYSDMVKQDDLVLVTGHGVPPSPPGWLTLLDVADVQNPSYTGFLNLGAGVYGVDVSGLLAFIAYVDGLGIIDISNPSNPILMNSRPTGGTAQDVVVRDDLAYVADPVNGIIIMDVSDPYSINPLASLQTPGYPYEIALSGDSLYIADSTALVVMNVADVYNPFITDIVPVEGKAQGVSVDNGKIFLCDKYGFHIYSHEVLAIGGFAVSETLPSSFHIACYPNPFNPTTMITFDLPVASQVTLNVFDISGARVGVGLAPTRHYNPGTHAITFDGSNLSSGIYFYRLEAGENTAVGKMVLLK